MAEIELIVHKINYDGSLTDVDLQNVLDAFQSVNILIVYLIKQKWLYVWIGKNAGKTLRKFIPSAEKQILDDHSEFTVLRHFTIEDGQESQELLSALHITKESLEKRKEKYNEYRVSIYAGISNLEIPKNNNAMLSKFDDAIKIAKEIIVEAEKVNDTEIIEAQNAFIQEMQNNKILREKKQNAGATIEKLKAKLHPFLENKKPLQAHEIANEIREIFSDLLKKTPDTPTQEILNKEKKLFDEFLLQEKVIQEKIKPLKKIFDHQIEINRFEEAKNFLIQIKDVIIQSKNPDILPEWDVIESDLLAKEALWIADQKEIQRNEIEIQKSIDQLKLKIETAIVQKNYENVLDNAIKIQDLVQKSTKTEYKQETQDFVIMIQNKVKNLKQLEVSVSEIQKSIEEADIFVKKFDFDEAIAQIEMQTTNASHPGLENYKTELEQKKKAIENMKQDFWKKTELLEKLKKHIISNQDQKKWQVGIENCHSIIRIAPEINQESLIKEYEIKKNDFQKNLDAEKELKRLENVELMKKAKELENIIETDENVLPLMDEFSISDLLGSLDDDVDQMLDQIGSLLETQRVEIKTEISSSSVIRSATGEVMELSSTTKVDTYTADLSSDEKNESVVKYSVNSGFSNPFDDFIEEAIVDDLIPYNFEITEILLNGEQPIEDPVKTLTKDGVQLQWKVQNIPPKENLSIHYDLKRRVSRTIILPLETQLKIIKTHTSMSPLKVEGLFDAKMKFANNFHTDLQGVVIEDIIPSFYSYEVKLPEAKNPQSELEESSGSLVKWNFKQIPENESALHRYQLLEIYKLEELKIQINTLSLAAFEELERGKLGEAIEKYAILAQKLKDYD